MRWPLRYQILLPMACVMLAVVVVVSCVDAWLAGQRAHEQIETQLQEIGRTLAGASFPLTDNVLKQMRGLSGAEFVVADRAGAVVASSLDHVSASQLPEPAVSGERAPLALQRRIPIAGQSYLHSQLELNRPFRGRDSDVLHVLYPERRYRQAWRDAVAPPVASGLAALLTVVLISSMIAARVTRPLHRLSEQVAGIARGDFAPLPISSRDDELRDLALAINRTAEMLTRYEQQVRRHEKLRTLGRLGGGIAHQLRNAVTGCRLALELHGRECGQGANESLAVARQQLDLMEEYLQRFLSLGKPDARPHAPLNLVDVIERSLALASPKAQHLAVALQWSRPTAPLPVAGDADQLAQALVNLLLNAIEAAAEAAAKQPASHAPPRVVVTLSVDNATANVRLEISDTGAGPAEHVRDQMYEPLVSAKPDGVGLGLSLAREVIEQHGGTLDWQRRADLTCFTVELPGGNAEKSHVKTAGRG